MDLEGHMGNGEGSRGKVREHAWERERSMTASGSLLHASTVVVKHETFEVSHKRFPSHNSFFFFF